MNAIIKRYDNKYFLTKEESKKISDFISERLNIKNIEDIHIYIQDSSTVLEIKGFDFQ